MKKHIQIFHYPTAISITKGAMEYDRNYFLSGVISYRISFVEVILPKINNCKKHKEVNNILSKAWK